MREFPIHMGHLKLEEATLVADSYCHSKLPYSETMAALNKQYGQPHQLVLQLKAELMIGPNIATGDTKAFRLFALRVRSLVGLLDIRSCQDLENVELLEAKTVRVEVDGYATPILRVNNMPQLRAPKGAVLQSGKVSRRSLLKLRKKSKSTKRKFRELELPGNVVKLAPTAEVDTNIGCYVRHHMVQHNRKNRVVFNCSL